VESAIYGVEDYGYSNSLHMVLTNIRNFGIFVKPHLVTGPKGTYPLPVQSDPNDFDRWKIENPGFSRSFSFPGLLGPNAPSILSNELTLTNVVYTGQQNSLPRQNSASTQENSAVFSKELKLLPDQATEIDVPVESAENFGLTLMAGSQVSATLIDDKGTIRGSNLANKEQANAFFRSIFVDKPVSAGTWKLKLENTSHIDQIVLVACWRAKSTTPPPPIRAPKPGTMSISFNRQT
jgi:hypothetical protein